MSIRWGSKTNTTKNHQSAPITLGGLDEPIRAELFSLERLEQHAAEPCCGADGHHEPRRAVRSSRG